MAKGGARIGAGRPGYRLKAEHTQRVDIRLWNQLGYLRDGAAFTWHWSRGDREAGGIDVSVAGDTVTLIYSVQDGPNRWRDASQSLSTTTTPCHLGGSRQWFSCPACHNRAAVLFQRDGRFACRKCQRISYSAQSGSAIDRLCHRFHRLHDAVKLGKPKWQRWATFDQLWDRFQRTSIQFDAVLDERLEMTYL